MGGLKVVGGVGFELAGGGWGFSVLVVEAGVRTRSEIEGWRDPSSFGGEDFEFEEDDDEWWWRCKCRSVQECWWRRLWRISRGRAVVGERRVEEDWVERRVVRAEGEGVGEEAIVVDVVDISRVDGGN